MHPREKTKTNRLVSIAYKSTFRLQMDTFTDGTVCADIQTGRWEQQINIAYMHAREQGEKDDRRIEYRKKVSQIDHSQVLLGLLLVSCDQRLLESEFLTVETH